MAGAQNAPPADGSWATVARRGRRKPELAHDEGAAALQRSLCPRAPARPLGAVTDPLSRSAWFLHTERLLRSALHGRSVCGLVCLGLGAVASNDVARHQLACAVLLARAFDVSEPCIADPVMDAADIAAARAAGFRVAKDEADFTASRTGALLIFMPHCHLDLYERVIGLCRSHDLLSNVVLLGNKLKRDMGAARVSSWFRTLCASENVRQELCLDATTAPLYNAFNDMAVVQFTGKGKGRE